MSMRDIDIFAMTAMGAILGSESYRRCVSPGNPDRFAEALANEAYDIAWAMQARSRSIGLPVASRFGVSGPEETSSKPPLRPLHGSDLPANGTSFLAFYDDNSGVTFHYVDAIGDIWGFDGEYEGPMYPAPDGNFRCGWDGGINSTQHPLSDCDRWMPLPDLPLPDCLVGRAAVAGDEPFWVLNLNWRSICAARDGE